MAEPAASPGDDSSAGRRQPRLFYSLMIAVVLIPAALGSSTTIFNDGDVSWHIATGQWIISHRAIPHTDPFSFTWAGKPWVPIEWLAEVIYAAGYNLAGFAGVAALVTATLMALHAIVFANASRFARPLLPVLAMDFVLVPMLFARPHVLVWPLLALWTWLMLRARGEDRAPPLAAALLMIVWANLHGSFVLGLAIAAFFGFEALVFSADRARVVRQWGLFGLACLAAVFVNANGIAGVLHPLRIANLSMLPLIDEWKHSDPRVTPWFFGALAVTLALIAWQRPKLPWTRWLLLAGMLGLALYQVRHQAMFAIVAAMVLPQGFGRPKREPARLTQADITVTAAAALALLIARTAMPLAMPEKETSPWKLIAAVPPEYRSLPVLNGYSMGGPLILSGIRPYVDGRGDMYGDELVVDYSRITGGDAAAFDSAVRRWRIRWAILPHRNSRLIALLDHRPDWHRIASDSAGVIYVRNEGSR